MAEPFGRLNRRVDVRPVPKKKPVQTTPSPSGTSAKLHLYLAGGALFLIMARFALAQ